MHDNYMLKGRSRMKKTTRKNFILGSLLFVILSRVIIAVGTFVRFKKIRDKYDKRIIFSGQEISFNGSIYEGQSIAVAFSGVCIDLRNAVIKDSAILDIYGEYCGVQIIVPKKCRVNIEGVSKMSVITNNMKDKKEHRKGPILMIKHDLRYSCLDVTNQSLKSKNKNKHKKNKNLKNEK